ncbi:cytochrome p450 [Nannochloropsis gaditana]|uniref:Cytochrome p450 n=1 Tax=Nannochloropsis gaditana TaxID=72520 RepID=W7SZV6_9STRA|nr:cytochrome p450 [Nannochloropsis gaditana]
MVRLFSECAQVLVDKLDEEEARASVVDMETLFCSVSLDIIGKAVFNYDFGSVTSESPVIKSVYSTLREAEHRSMSFVPYWKLPFADKLLKDQVLPSLPPALPPSLPPYLPHSLHFSRS